MTKVITDVYYVVPRDDSGDVISGAAATALKATIDGSPCFVPLDMGNADYAQIQEEVAAGTLAIRSADDFTAVLNAQKAADGH